MSPARVIRINLVWEMLNECAPGYTSKPSDHYHVISFRAKRFFFPLGPHGARNNPEIEAGHVRGLARQFGIEDCARVKLGDLVYSPR